MEKSKRGVLIFAAAVIAVSALFIVTRLYKLDVAPFGAHMMHVDEVGAAYDAFCISEYGVDQFLLKMPVYFRCFGEGQNALYTYAASLIFKIFGVSVFNFRIVAVIFATAAFASLFFLVRDLAGKWQGVLALFFMTVMPVFVMSEHWGLEAYLWMSFVIISMFFTVHAILSDKDLFYFPAGLFWGITLYTYAMSYVIVPLFLAVTFVVLLRFKKLNIKRSLLAGIPFVLLGIPLFVEQLVTMGYLQPFTFLGMVDFWVPEYTRYHSISLEYLKENLLMSFKYIYVADSQVYNSSPAFGTLYYISIPFVLIGMVTSAVSVVKKIRAKELDPWLFIWIYYIVSRAFLLLVEEPNVNRINGMYPIYLLFVVYAVWTVAKKLNSKTVRWAFCIIVFAAYMFMFYRFSDWFYSSDGLQSVAIDPGEGLGINVEAGEAAALAKKIAAGKPVIALVNDGYYRHLAMALFTETSPYEYNREHDPEDRVFNGVDWHMPDGLDLSGATVYLIDAELLHITQYLQSEGFSVDITYPDFTVVYR